MAGNELCVGLSQEYEKQEQLWCVCVTTLSMPEGWLKLKSVDHKTVQHSSILSLSLPLSLSLSLSLTVAALHKGTIEGAPSV